MLAVNIDCGFLTFGVIYTRVKPNLTNKLHPLCHTRPAESSSSRLNKLTIQSQRLSVICSEKRQLMTSADA